MSEVLIYCPRCRTEYREGFITCTDCETPLVRRLEEEAGDDLVPLAREADYEFVGELVNQLEKNEIPYVIHAGTALQFLDGGACDEIAKPQPWEARIWVPGAHERRARALRDDLESERRRTRGTEITRRYLNYGE